MKRALISIAIFLPSIALAATDKLQNFKQLVYFVLGLVNLAIPVAVSLAILVFFWGLARYILASGDPKGNEAGKNLMIWGLIALFVLVSYLGIINIAQHIFGIDQSTYRPGYPGTVLPLIPTK